MSKHGKEKRMAKWLLVLPPVFFAALAGMFYVGMQRENPQDIPSVFLNKAVPALPATGLAGHDLLKAEDLTTGQVTVVNFWATWCPPCREELPEFSKLATQFPGKPVSFYSVCIDQEKDLIASVVNETQPKPPAAYDEGGAAATAFQVSFLPTTVLVAPDGVIHSAHIGYSTSMLEELRGNINALLAAAPAK